MDDEIEIWKQLPFLQDHEISNFGNARTIERYLPLKSGFRIHHGKKLVPSDNGNGYLIISTRINKERKNLYIHRLVALLFVENPDNKTRVNHKDANKRNNHYSNIEWMTAKENTHHALDAGLIPFAASKKSYRPIINLETGIFYDCLKEAYEAHGIVRPTLYTWLKKPRINKSSLVYAD